MSASSPDKIFLNFPEPTGQWAIGKRSYHLVDSSRCEPHVADPSIKREVMVRVWYPTAKEPGKNYKHIDSESCFYGQLLEMCTKAFKISEEPCKKALNLVTYASPDASIAKNHDKFPVLLFSPGFSNTADIYTTFIEEIVSHGYIVIGFDHPYFCERLLMPDGRMVRGGYGLYFKNSDAERKDYHQFNDYLTKEITAITDDVVFVLNLLNNNKSPFDKDILDGMDLENVGMLGHSAGGTSSLRMSRIDNRVKAVLNLDGALFGAVPNKGFQKPILNLLAEKYLLVPTNFTEAEGASFGMDAKNINAWFDHLTNDELLAFCRNMGSFSHEVIIKASAHQTFKNHMLYRPEVACKLIFGGDAEAMLGSIEPYKALKITKDFIQQFFDKHLRGKAAPELDSGTLHGKDVIIANKRHWHELQP